MSLINKKSLVIGVVTFLVGTFAVATFFGFSLFKSNSTVTGKITNILLDREGRANGMTLDSGLQVNFSPETGDAVFAAAKIGDEVSVTGDAGTKNNYGQAFHAKQLTANGQTFTEISAPKPPKGDHPHPPKGPKGPKPPKGPEGERPAPPAPETNAPNGEMPPAPNAPNAENAPADADGVKPAPENAPLPPKPAGEAMSANGTIQQFLVTMRGDVDGVILTSGEQIRFSPKVGEQIISNNLETNSPIAVEGLGVKNERGTVLKATKMTIGNQTFTIND